MLNILFVITLIDVMVANEVDLDNAFGRGISLYTCLAFVTITDFEMK